MDIAPEETKRKVMARYIKVLKEEPEFEVLRFEEAFFRADDLSLLHDSDANTAKAHLVDQIGRAFGPRLDSTLSGLGKIVTRKELKEIATAVVQYVAAGDGSKRRGTAERALRTLWNDAADKNAGGIAEGIQPWQAGTGPDEWKKWLAGLARSMPDPTVVPTGDETDLDDLPF